MKITRKEDKFILGSTVVDSAVLKGTAGLEKQLLTNALNLLKFPQKFGFDGKTMAFTSDVEQSGRILDVFSDAVWEYNPKTTVYEKKGKLSEVFNNKSIIFNENTGKTYYLKDGKFKKISDLNFKVSRGDEVVRELENRVQDVEKRMGDSGNRFSIVSALPANPDKDTLYIVVGEGQIEDTELQGMDLTELTAKISECITSNLNLTTIVNELQSGENAQNERMDEINGSFDGINTSIASNTNEITSLKSRVQTNETTISTLRTDLGTANTTLSADIQKNSNDIADIKEDLQNLASSDTITGLDNRLTVAEGDIALIKQANTTQSDDISGLKTQVQTNTGDIADIKETISSLGSNDAIVALSDRVQTNETNIANIQDKVDNLAPEDIAGLQEFIENNNGAIEVVEALPEEPKPDTLYVISGEGNSLTITKQTIDNIHSRITANEEKNAVQDEKINALVSQANSSDTNIEGLSSSLTTLQSDLEKAKGEINGNKASIESLENLQAGIRVEVDNLKTKDGTLETSINETNDNITTLSNSVSSSLETLQSSISDLSKTVDNNALSADGRLDSLENGLDVLDDKVQSKIKIVDTVPETPEEDTLYLISEEEGHSKTITVQDIVTLQNSVSSLTELVQTQAQTIKELQGTLATQGETISTSEMMLDNQANIIRAQTDLINRMKAKLDMIDFDTLSLGGETYDIVVKSE